MRRVTEVIVHCTATPEGRHTTVDEIREWHKQRGWRDIGYHKVVYLDGSVHNGRPISEVGAHVKGHNEGTIGIVYVGGVAKDGKTPKDTRTPAQKEALVKVIVDLMKQFPSINKISGHNQYAPKACPSFDAQKEYANIPGNVLTWATKPPAPSDARIAWLQKLLVRAGFDCGQTDGIVGDKTRAAVKEYQKFMGLKVTGSFDRDTVDALKGVSPEVTPAIDKVLDDADKKLTTSKQVISTVVGGTSGVAATANEISKAAKEAQTAADALWAAGPWVLLAMVIFAACVYVVMERKRKADDAREAKKSKETG